MPNDKNEQPAPNSTDCNEKQIKNYNSKSKLIKVLNNIQIISGLAFGSFTVIHIAAPISSALISPSVVDDVVMIGRTLYHQPYIEMSIFSSIIIHILSGSIKRMIKKRKSINIQQRLGWLGLPILLSHILTHRVIPSLSTPPISNLSPSELTYSNFVNYSLRFRPYFSIFTYTTLSTILTYHSIAGLWRKFKKSHIATFSVVNTAIISTGLFRLLDNVYNPPSYILPRFEAVYNLAEINI